MVIAVRREVQRRLGPVDAERNRYGWGLDVGLTAAAA